MKRSIVEAAIHILHLEAFLIKNIHAWKDGPKVVTDTSRPDRRFHDCSYTYYINAHWATRQEEVYKGLVWLVSLSDHLILFYFPIVFAQICMSLKEKGYTYTGVIFHLH